MSGLLDGVFKSLANSLINTFGATCTIITPQGSGYDPVLGMAYKEEPLETVVNCSPPEGYANRDIDGTRIRAGDMFVLIPSAQYATVPETSQMISIRGNTYSIVDVSPLSSGNQDAAWKVQLRR